MDICELHSLVNEWLRIQPDLPPGVVVNITISNKNSQIEVEDISSQPSAEFLAIQLRHFFTEEKFLKLGFKKMYIKLEELILSEWDRRSQTPPPTINDFLKKFPTQTRLLRCSRIGKKTTGAVKKMFADAGYKWPR